MSPCADTSPGRSPREDLVRQQYPSPAGSFPHRPRNSNASKSWAGPGLATANCSRLLKLPVSSDDKRRSKPRIPTEPHKAAHCGDRARVERLVDRPEIYRYDRWPSGRGHATQLCLYRDAGDQTRWTPVVPQSGMEPMGVATAANDSALQNRGVSLRVESLRQSTCAIAFGNRPISPRQSSSRRQPAMKLVKRLLSFEPFVR